MTDTSEGKHTSIWIDTTPATDYPPLTDDLEVDTAIIGGGIAGIATGYNLVEAGQSVALIERDRILNAVTGHTTAKLTAQHGLIYSHLLDGFGEEQAKQYAAANTTAIDEVETRASANDISCEFERTPAFTYTESPDGRDAIQKEVDAAQRLGLPASLVESTELPYEIEAAVRFSDQARFHPRKYLLALAKEIADRTGQVFESTRAVDIESGDPCRITTDRGDVNATDVVVATHFPFFDHALYFARLSPKRSYVIAAQLSDDIPHGMFYQPEDPYFSVRPQPTSERPLVLIGGQNHRTGHSDDTRARYRQLIRQAEDRFDIESIDYRWSTQDYVSIDRVPFIGKHAPRTDHVHVATGFGGWGMTNGIAAGRILADRILGRENPWQDVYKPTRFRWRASTGSLLEHNTHAMKHFFEDHLTAPPHDSSHHLDRGEATIIDASGDPVGIYRDDAGEYHAVSAICTHMGCRVEWNAAERSWDCPCHGSRFHYEGTVLDTPAVEGLDRYTDDELPQLGIEPPD